MLRASTLGLICWATLFSARLSLACSCAERKPAPCQEVWSAAALFAGTVTRIEAAGDENQNRNWRVHLSITEAFTGLTSDLKEIDVLTGVGGSACGFHFERGHTYLVYATRLTDGALSTSFCTRTASLDDASEDLAYLHSLPMRKPVGEVQGRAETNRTGWPWSPMPDVGITIASDQLKKTTTTDSNGSFAVMALPPGQYTVTAAAEGYWAGAPKTVSVPAKGCADVWIEMSIDRAITGLLLDSFGQPAPKVTVELFATDLKIGYFRAISDSHGRYEFRRLPAGEYYLGVNTGNQPLPENPYPTSYYPGVSDFTKALSFGYGNRPQVITVNFPLPEPLQLVSIKGRVQWPDGRPAAGIDVFPEDPDFPQQLGMIRFPTDENGEFTAKLFEKINYRLYAVYYDPFSHTPTSAEPVAIVPSATNKSANVRLVLSHPGDLMTPDQSPLAQISPRTVC